MTEKNTTTTDEQHGQMNRRAFLSTVGAGAGTVAVGASGVGPVPSPVEDSEALLPAAAAVVAGVGVAGALGAFVESKYDFLGSDAPPDSLGPEALKDQVIQTAKTRKSTNASTLTDNKNLVTYVKEPAFVEGKVAAVKAINNEKAKSEVESAALDAANSHIATVEENMLNTWEESTDELFSMISNLQSAGVTVSNFIHMKKDEYEAELKTSPMSTSVTLSDGSSFQVTRLAETSGGDYWSPVNVNGTLPQPYGVIVGSSPTTYLRSDDWGNTWSELQTVQTDVTNNLATWIDTAYNQVQKGQLSPNNLLSPTDLADSYAGENSRAIADLQALNVPNAGGNEATIKVSDNYNSRLTGLLASSDGAVSNLTVGETVDPSATSADWFISHDLGKWTATVTRYYDQTYGIQGGQIRATRNPQYHYGNKSKGVSHVVETSQGETAEIPTSDFSEQMDENNNPYWSVNIAGKLENSTADIAKVTAVTTGEQSGIYRTEQLTNPFEVVETADGELSFDTPREPQTDSNYLTQEEWDNLEQNTQDNIEAYEDSQSATLPGAGGGFLSDLPSIPGFSTIESLAIAGVGAWIAGQLSN